jgi:hypothetical protein
MIKLIYLAKRKPGFTPDEFTRRWRMHGARGMSVSMWRHAIACYIVKDDAFTSEPILPDDADANQLMADDELETFSGPIIPVAMFVDEEVLTPGILGGTSAYLFFADREKARKVGQSLQAAPEINRLIVNIKRTDAALGPLQGNLPFDAVVEVSATDLPALRNVVTGDVLNSADVAMVTREAVLWDRMS